MKFDVTSDEIKWLNKNYPKLSFTKGDPSTISGTLDFDMVYFGDMYRINPIDSKDLSHKGRIKDSYDIEVTLESTPSSILPQVKETGGRIKKAKEKHNKKLLADVHMYASENLCLCARPEESKRLPNGFNLMDYFNNLVIPHFYAQSHFEKTGKWIWGDRSHGSLGIFESYFEFRENGDDVVLIKSYLEDLKKTEDSKDYLEVLSKKGKIKGHWLCFCKSNTRFRNCHPEAFKGMWNLKEDTKRNKIPLPS